MFERLPVVRTGFVASRSVDLRIEQLLRPRRIHVRLGDDARADIDSRRHLLPLGGGECGLDALVTDAERVADKQGGDRRYGS